MNSTGFDTHLQDFKADFFTSAEDAVSEITKRRQDVSLIKKVESFLEGDIPTHFENDMPICYMARHIATPNFETLRFIEIAKKTNLPIVIGEDTEDIFTSNNPLKKRLAKLSVQKCTTRATDDTIENFTIVDFNAYQGKRLKDVCTIFGDTLSNFHTHLFNLIYPDTVSIKSESDWISRNFRGNLVDHYTRAMALLLVHGIMFEWYPPYEMDFVKSVVEPAIENIKREFGIAPLIVELVDDTYTHDIDRWEMYPSVFYPFIKKMYENKLNLKDLDANATLSVTKKLVY